MSNPFSTKNYQATLQAAAELAKAQAAAAATSNATSTSNTVPGTRPMGGRTSHTAWNSNKIQRTLSVTNDAWEAWTTAAEQAGINRSELFEVLARTASEMDITSLRNAALRMASPALVDVLK